MLIGLIADSHDHVRHIQKAVKIFKERNVELVLHAGDFCSPFTIPPFEGLTLKGVFGNNDGDHYLILQKFSEIGATHLGSFGEVTADQKTIALYHGTDMPITEALEQAGKYDVVVSGHTHEKKVEFVGNTLAVNPGTAHGFDGESSIALLDTDTMDVAFIELN
ncbi:YfcE family phosphodiesterase [Aliifodinibius salipaludis]|uniref:Phosphoesterase n=1 Tax=Fodinibius salipaludis TaxID=2032627 RepID=A0A2A2GBC5_9BACT|nr:metallophosphoesterase [Aliifodinibius salipaludis]PAU94177.1 YfcE family phosphodiesterase [Aliifodinibius salipaludis]